MIILLVSYKDRIKNKKEILFIHTKIVLEHTNRNKNFMDYVIINGTVDFYRDPDFFRVRHNFFILGEPVVDYQTVPILLDNGTGIHVNYFIYHDKAKKVDDGPDIPIALSLSFEHGERMENVHIFRSNTTGRWLFSQSFIKQKIKEDKKRKKEEDKLK